MTNLECDSRAEGKIFLVTGYFVRKFDKKVYRLRNDKDLGRWCAAGIEITSYTYVV